LRYHPELYENNFNLKVSIAAASIDAKVGLVSAHGKGICTLDIKMTSFRLSENNIAL